jgi:hypothetical protein
VHIAIARTGSTAAQDAALFNGAVILGYRSPDPFCTSHADDQSNARVLLWNSLPTLVGSAWRTCNPSTDSDWLIARFKPHHLFGSGFE